MGGVVFFPTTYVPAEALNACNCAVSANLKGGCDEKPC